MKINASTKSQVELAPCAHPTRQPSRPRTMPFSAPLQDRTTLSLLTFLELAVCVALVLTWWASTPSALRPAIELLHADPHFAEVLKKSVRHAGTIALLSLLFLLLGNMSFFFHPRPSTQRMHLILFVGWTVMTHLMKFRKTKNRKFPLFYFWSNSIHKTLLVLSLAVPQEF